MNGIILADQWSKDEDYYPRLRRVIHYMEENGFEEIYFVKPFDVEGMDEFISEFDSLIVYTNTFYKNYNDIYSLSLIDPEFKDTYIVNLKGELNHNVLYDFEQAMVFVTERREGDAEYCYETDKENRVIGRKEPCDDLPVPVGIYFLKGLDMELFREAMTEFLGVTKLTDETLGIDTILEKIRSKINLKTYTIPRSYIQ